MFSRRITNTPFYNEFANEYFSNITGDDYGGDLSFTSTLRALLGSRMPKEDRVYLRHTISNYTASQLADMAKKKAVKTIYDDSRIEEGTFTVHGFVSDDESNLEWIKFIKAQFQKVYKDYILLDKYEQFFSQTMPAICFIRPETKNVVVFLCDLDIRTWHYLQLSVSVCLPWYFSDENKMQPDSLDHQLAKSLKEKDPSLYIELLTKMAEKYDFRQIKIRRLLQGFEQKYEKEACDRTESEIETCVHHINRISDDLRDCLKKKEELEIRLLGLQNKINSGEDDDSEIMDFFMCNRNLELESVTDRNMRFVVKDYLDIYDEENAEVTINNERSLLYRINGDDMGDRIPHDDMKMLMEAIFIDQTLRIKFCARYNFDLGGRVSAISGDGAGYDDTYGEYMPNPHIYFYSCLGSYQKLINECLISRDYIGAISQCIASAKSLNFSDPTVLASFVKCIYGTETRHGGANNKCIELPDGSVVKPKKAIEWLKSQQEGANE